MTTQTKSGKVQVRFMKPKDIDAIFDVDRTLLGEERAATLISLATEEFKEEPDLSLVAEADNQLVGFILARHTYVGEPVVEASVIQGIGIHPLYQGQGIGARLVEALIERSQSKGIKTIRVMISNRDSRIEGFFSKINFRRAKLVVLDRII